MLFTLRCLLFPAAPTIRRFLARARSVCPLCPVLAGLLLGQAIAWWLGPVLALGGAALLAGLGAQRDQRRRSYFALFVGLGLGLFTAESRPPPGSHSLVPADAARLLVRVSSVPSRPEPGLVKFEAYVQQQLSSASSPQPWRNHKILCRAVDLPWKSVSGIRNGDELALLAKVRPVEPGVNPADYNARIWRRGIRGECKVRYAAMLERGKPSVMERLHLKLHEFAVSRIGNNEGSGLLMALVLGERDGVSVRTERAFRDTGLSHVLVLSGYQISLVYMLSYAALSCLLSTCSVPAGCSLPRMLSLVVSAAFVAIVGVEASSLRAMLALGAVVSAHLCERHSTLWNTIGVSLFLMCIVWPGIFFEPGVQLTFAALVGIALGQAARTPREPPWRTYVRISCWATVLPMLVGLLWFGRVSPLGIVLNPLIAPVFASVGTVGGGIALALGVLRLDSSGLLLKVVVGALEWQRDYIIAASRLPIAGWEPSWSTSLAMTAVVSLLFAESAGCAMQKLLTNWNISLFGCRAKQAFGPPRAHESASP